MVGKIKDGWLIKEGKQVVKFWKYNGYAIPFKQLEKIKGVVLYTEYDGVLKATSAQIMENGVYNIFKDEKQLVLGVGFWEVVRGKSNLENN